MCFPRFSDLPICSSRVRGWWGDWAPGSDGPEQYWLLMIAVAKNMKDLMSVAIRNDCQGCAVCWKNFNSIKRSWEVKYTGHGIFIEFWNTTKCISTIWERFSCLLDEGIAKIWKKFYFHDGFLNYIYICTCKKKKPIQPILHQFFPWVCLKKP